MVENINLFGPFPSRYGGPGTQTVDHRWTVGWDTYLASKRDFVVANIDVRGSGFQVKADSKLSLRLVTALCYL